MKELLNTGVNLPLEYDGGTDALIGQIKGYSVAIKENLSTSSYGCLFWIKQGESAPDSTAEAYLRGKQESNPEFIKKFMISETGAAVALNRTYDDFANVNNLKRFIFDFTTSLSLNHYKNCCCECGKTTSLALYTAEGTIAQACSECGAKYQFLKSVECEAEPSPSETEIPAEKKEEPSFVVPEMPVVEKFPAELTESKEEDFESLLTPVEEQKSELPRDNIEETAKVDLSKDSDDSFAELMFTEIKQEPVVEEQPEPVAAQQSVENFDSLLFTGEEEKKAEPVKSALFEQIEREYAAEQERLAAQTVQQVSENNLNDLLIDGGGEFTLKEIEPEVDDGSSDVTEYHDDTNEGEDIEIEEIETTVNVPTVTTGHPQLTAEETPLEADGSVPLINPNSHREERHVSAVDGPDAVQPLELAASITHEDLGELPDIQLPPGYATGENMERDVPDSMYPPPYNPTYDYSSYDKIKFRTTSNAFMGIIGIFVLGLLGIAVWLLIGSVFGKISYLGSLAIVFSVYGGYYLAGGALDKKGIVISFIMSIVLTVVGSIAVLSIEMTDVISETLFTEATLKDGFNWVIMSLSNEETKNVVLIDIGISMLITLIADISAAVKSWRTA